MQFLSKKHRNNNEKNKQKSLMGFTLIEILIVISIFSILFAFISAPLMSFYKDVVYRGNVENVLTMIDEARKSTLSSYYSSQYGVHLSTSTVTLFRGDTYSEEDTNNDVYDLSGIVEITEININGSVYDIVFERITGETTGYGTIEISLLTGSTSPKTITIYKSGLVEID